MGGLDVPAPGRTAERVLKFSPVNTRRGAEQYERELRASLLTGTFGKENNSEERPITLAEFAPRFLTYSENNNKHSSVVSKRQILDDHLLPFFGQMALDCHRPRRRSRTSRPSCARRSPRRAPGRKPPRGPPSASAGDVEPKPLSLKTINNVLTVLQQAAGARGGTAGHPAGSRA